MISLLVTSLVLSQGYYTPDEAKQLFAQSNEAYYSGHLDRAVDGYQKLVDTGFGGPDVLYNLGTSYLAKGDLGHGVLYLERARRSGANDDDVQANLAVARTKQLDQVVGGSEDDPFVLRVAAAVPARVAGMAFLSAWLTGFVLLILFRFLPKGRRSWAAVGGGLLVALALPAGGVLAAHASVARALEEAVVLEATLPARELPSEGSKISFEVHAGLKVHLMETDGRFVRILLPNGLVGWAPKDGLSEI